MNRLVFGFVSQFAAFLATSAFAQEAAKVRTIDVPSVGVSQTIPVGSTLHEYSKIYTYDAYVPSAEMKGGQWILPLVVPAGTALFAVPTKTKLKACAPEGPCGLDDDGDGIFDRMAQDDVAIALKLKVKVPYERKSVEIERPDSFRKAILYQGATNDGLRLSYREFQNNMARPAFTEDLVIPLAAAYPQDVAVKEIKIRIYSIDGLGMRYELLP